MQHYLLSYKWIIYCHKILFVNQTLPATVLPGSQSDLFSRSSQSDCFSQQWMKWKPKLEQKGRVNL